MKPQRFPYQQPAEPLLWRNCNNEMISMRKNQVNLQTEIMQIMVRQELEMNKIKDDYERLKQEHDELKRKHNELRIAYNEQKTGYKSWNSQDIVNWIVNLNRKRYYKYCYTLMNNVIKEEINGNIWGYLRKSDLYSLGITDNRDKNNIFEQIQKLVRVD